MAVVYKHIRLDKNQVFYIGIGKDTSRAYDFHKYSRNNLWNKIYNKTEIRVEIIYENLSWKEACNKEIELIKSYGRIDLKTGILTNMTDGGDGLYNPSEEIRISKRLSMIGKNSGENHWTKKYKERSHPMLGRSQSLESKTKMSNSRKGKISKTRIPIIAFRNNVKIGEFSSMTEAGNELKIDFRHISKLIKENRSDKKGYVFKKVEEVD